MDQVSNYKSRQATPVLGDPNKIILMTLAASSAKNPIQAGSRS